MTKQQINIAHCVQCGRELLGQVEIESKQIVRRHIFEKFVFKMFLVGFKK